MNSEYRKKCREFISKDGWKRYGIIDERRKDKRMNDKEWIKERIKEWIFGILVGLGFFGLYVIACLAKAGVI